MRTVRHVQLAGGLVMFGDQCRILLGRLGVSSLDRGGQAAVPLGAIECQLQFVGHRAGRRVVERVRGLRGVPAPDRSAWRDQLVDDRLDPDSLSASAPNVPDHRRRAQRPLGLAVQAVDARPDGRP